MPFELAFRREMVANQLIGQPLPLKRLYLSGHDRATAEKSLDVIETILRKLSAGRTARS
ncbi:hypothetical protein NKI31_26750 [Mesorhizobium sp. M0659]|uniref:hypothetical protein n=1 Tax=Mesorhizobium sp. M0659 TaxID=2956980 RepID=UPI00333A4734